MKIEIEFDAIKISESIETIIHDLPVEQKARIATEVLTKWLTEPHDYERSINDSKILELAKEERRKSGSYYGSTTDSEIRNSHYYREAQKKFFSSREQMVQSITDSAIAHYREKAELLVRTDPQIQKIVNECVESFVSNFPQMCQNAMTSWFLEHIKDIQKKIVDTQLNTESVNMNFQTHISNSHKGQF